MGADELLAEAQADINEMQLPAPPRFPARRIATIGFPTSTGLSHRFPNTGELDALIENWGERIPDSKLFRYLSTC